uniref:Cytolethal distending toxin B n=2 Tax=Scaptomyza TaxID=7298 RepID=A0A513TXT4_9MUSC|nr:cytolethal distending toxin B [Scaptomyza nr. nigrita KIV-2019]QDF82162.1 cytolethal distending toxin B [Scaptomyza flava]QDH44045.1 cytolethal distending toxin B [synthetic construct]
MAIITRERASKVYIIPAHSRDPYRIDVNRPTIGVKLSGYTVFTAHSDPNKNEIVDTIGKVARFMASENQCQQTKWILMGDFNEEPAVVNRRLPQASNGCVISIVSPAAATRQASGKIIDYGVYGGPPSTAGSLQATTRTGEGNSDHWPVQIMPAPMNG